MLFHFTRNEMCNSDILNVHVLNSLLRGFLVWFGYVFTSRGQLFKINDVVS